MEQQCQNYLARRASVGHAASGVQQRSDPRGDPKLRGARRTYAGKLATSYKIELRHETPRRQIPLDLQKHLERHFDEHFWAVAVWSADDAPNSVQGAYNLVTPHARYTRRLYNLCTILA